MIKITISGSTSETVREKVEDIKRQLPVRANRVAQEMIIVQKEVLGRGGSGRMYGSHQASAPGEPPAPMSGGLRGSFVPTVIDGGNKVISRIESFKIVNGYNQGDLLEGGTSKMAPRPFEDEIGDAVEPIAYQIYSEDY